MLHVTNIVSFKEQDSKGDPYAKKLLTTRMMMEQLRVVMDRLNHTYSVTTADEKGTMLQMPSSLSEEKYVYFLAL